MPLPLRPPRWLILLLLTGGVALGFGVTLGGDFVFDDQILIVNNPAVHSPEIFAARVFGSLFAGTVNESALVFFRPLILTTYFVTHRIAGLTPWPYHLTNLLLHLLNGLLAVGVARVWFGLRPWAALAAGLVFVLHPAQTESVAWIAGRTDVLAATGLFGALLLTWRWLRRPSLALLTGVLALYHVALLSKENALILAPLLVPLVWHRWRLLDRRGQALRRSAYLAGVLTLFALNFLLWRAVALSGERAQVAWPTGSPSTTLLSIPRVLMLYVRLLVWPHPYTLDYTLTNQGIVTSPSEILFWLPLLGCLLLATLTLRLLWRRSPAGAALAWFWLMIAPVSQVRPLVILAAERYLYLPVFGAAVIAGLCFHWLWTRAPRVAVEPARCVPRRALATLLGLCLLLGVVNIPRSLIWRTDETLFRHALSRDPLNAHKLLNCADILVDFGHHEEAYELLQENPVPHIAFYDRIMADCLFRMRRPVEAEARLVAALDYARNYTGVHELLAEWYLLTGRVEAAEVLLREASKIDPDSQRIRLLQAQAREARGRVALAAAIP